MGYQDEDMKRIWKKSDDVEDGILEDRVLTQRRRLLDITINCINNL